MKFNKKGESKIPTWLLVVVGVMVIFAVFPNARFWDKEASAAPSTSTPITPGASGLCPAGVNIEDVTMTFGPVQEMYNPTYNAETNEILYHRIFQNGVDIGLKQDGTTYTMDVGDKVATFYAANASTNGDRYYTAKQEFVVPCDGGEVTTSQMPDSNAFKLYSANNVSVKVFNEDDGDLNSATNNESIANGDVLDLDVNVDGVFEDAFSPYGKIILVVDVNGSMYDDIEVVIGGVSAPVAAVPKSHIDLSAASDTYGFEMPGCVSTCDIDFKIVVDADDTLNPGTADDITITFFDQEWYLNSDSGVMEFGANNDEDADVGYTNQAVTIQVA